MNRYAIKFMAKCPNNDEVIIYALGIESKVTIMVEDILIAVGALPGAGFHEDIADVLTVALPGRHTLSAHHHGVPGRLPARPLWPTPIPERWWEHLLRVYRSGVLRVLVEIIQQNRV